MEIVCIDQAAGRLSDLFQDRVMRHPIAADVPTDGFQADIDRPGKDGQRNVAFGEVVGQLHAESSPEW